MCVCVCILSDFYLIFLSIQSSWDVFKQLQLHLNTSNNRSWAWPLYGLRVEKINATDFRMPGQFRQEALSMFSRPSFWLRDVFD